MQWSFFRHAESEIYRQEPQTVFTDLFTRYQECRVGIRNFRNLLEHEYIISENSRPLSLLWVWIRFPVQFPVASAFAYIFRNPTSGCIRITRLCVLTDHVFRKLLDVLSFTNTEFFFLRYAYWLQHVCSLSIGHISSRSLHSEVISAAAFCFGI
jgi:hypothetical protein